jgi:hypothetical protein
MFRFFVQTHAYVNGKKEDVMSNISIFMKITHVFFHNLSITYADSNYKNDCYVSNLTSGGYIELVDVSYNQ